MRYSARVGVGIMLLSLLLGFLYVNFYRPPKDTDKPLTNRTVLLAGSSSMQPLMQELVNRYQGEHLNLDLQVKSTDSSNGVAAVIKGEADIGLASRELYPDEQGIKGTTIARDAIIVIVHPSNPVANLTLTQVRGIFGGEITNWKTVGGPDLPILVIDREPGSGTRDFFIQAVMAGKNMSAKGMTQNATDTVRQSVSNDPGAIGYISLYSLREEVRSVAIDGVSATPYTVADGRYSIVRPFVLVTKDNPEEQVNNFIDYCLDKPSQLFIQKSGLVRVKL